MNTTNTKSRLTTSGSRSLPKHGAIQMAKQVERKNETQPCLSRWPTKTKNSSIVTTVTSENYNNSKISNSNMNTLNIRKLLLVALGFIAVVLFAATLLEMKGLSVAGDTVGYLSALVILALAALDNPRAKRLV